jgi:hypothetical protein
MVGTGVPAALRILENEGAANKRPGNKGHCNKGLLIKGLATPRLSSPWRRSRKKKPGPREPGLRYWPREADTITFQEGLLNVRATGGGGQMRDVDAQRGDTMIPVSALRKPFKPHVSHAESGGYRVIIKTASAAPC